MSTEPEDQIIAAIDAAEVVRDPLEGLAERAAVDPAAPFAVETVNSQTLTVIVPVSTIMVPTAASGSAAHADADRLRVGFLVEPLPFSQMNCALGRREVGTNQILVDLDETYGRPVLLLRCRPRGWVSAAKYADARRLLADLEEALGRMQAHYAAAQIWGSLPSLVLFHSTGGARSRRGEAPHLCAYRAKLCIAPASLRFHPQASRQRALRAGRAPEMCHLRRSRKSRYAFCP